MDSWGNAIAVWVQHDSSTSNIYMNRFNPLTGSWGISPTLLESSRFAAGAPRVKMSARNGYAIVTWRQGKVHNFTPPSIYARQLIPAQGWSATTQIDVNSWDWQIGWDADVAIDDQGSALVAWLETNGNDQFIYARRYTSGNWDNPVQLDASYGYFSSLRLAMNMSGNAMAVWKNRDFGVGGKEFTTSGGWAAGTWVNKSTADGQGPRGAMDDAGDAVAVWAQQDNLGGIYNIYGNWYTHPPNCGSSWGTPALLETSAQSAFTPQVAVIRPGQAVAVWTQDSENGRHVYASVYW